MSRARGIDWAAQPLGQVTDAELARRLGVTHAAVTHQRRARGISRCRHPDSVTHTIDWSAQPLGLEPDHVIGERLGVSARMVFAARRERGIAVQHRSPPGDHTPKQVRECARLLEQRVGYREIAERIGSTEGRVYRLVSALRASGVSDRRTLDASAIADRRRRVSSLHADGYSAQEIAEQLGLRVGLVRRDLVAAGIDLGRNHQRRRATASSERGAEALRLAAEGLTTREIAAELGVHTHRVLRWLAASTAPEAAPERTRQRVARITQALALRAAGRTTEQIARALEVRVATVREYLRDGSR